MTPPSSSMFPKKGCREFMRFDGVWRVCDDDVVRPVIRGEVKAADGAWAPVPFLVDVGADSTVFSAAVRCMFGDPDTGATQELEVVGGKVTSVILTTSMRLIR